MQTKLMKYNLPDNFLLDSVIYGENKYIFSKQEIFQYGNLRNILKYSHTDIFLWIKSASVSDFLEYKNIKPQNRNLIRFGKIYWEDREEEF